MPIMKLLFWSQALSGIYECIPVVTLIEIALALELGIEFGIEIVYHSVIYEYPGYYREH